MKNKSDKIVQDFGEVLGKLLSGYFGDSAWYEKSLERNKTSVISLLESITVMTCTGMNENWTESCLLRLDLHLLPNHHPGYAEKIKDLKNRFCIVNAKSLRTDYLPGITQWDIDAEVDLAHRLIEYNS